MYNFRDPNLRSSHELAHQIIVIQRRYLVQAFLRSAARGIAIGLYALGRADVRIVQGLSAGYRLRNDIRALQQFDDRMLADIGVSRHGIDWVVRNGRPAPKAPVVLTYARRMLPPVGTTHKGGKKIQSSKVRNSAG